MKEDLVLYLRLTPEFGGTRFGPFEGIEVALGSEAGRCDITLPQNLGVLGVHVRLMRQADSSMILAPTERTATIFLWKQQARAPVQIDTPTAVRPGDSFALVTESGPRFIIELGELPQEMKDARDKKQSIRDKRLSKEAFGKEAKRQVWTRILVTGPGQFVQRAATFIKSGAIFQPRYIFLGITMAAGYIWAGGLTCKGRNQAKLLESQSAKIETCNKELGFAQGDGEDTDWTFPQLVAGILGIEAGKGGLGVALEEDTKLADAVWEQAKIILPMTSQYRWLLDSKGDKARAFADLRERIAGDEAIDLETARILPYLAADPSKHQGDWDHMEDSLTVDVCTRGPLHLTYRQALHLGLGVQVDGFVPASKVAAYKGNDKTLHEQVLRATLDGAGMGDFPAEFQSTVGDMVNGDGGCVYVEGSDQRTEAGAMISRLAEQIGIEAAMVPGTEASVHATSARLGKLFAADLPEVDYRNDDSGRTFVGYPLSTVTASMESKGEWVIRNVARIIARAIVLPCEAAVDPKVDKKKAATTLGELPPLTQCLMLDWRLRADVK
jgi:hypothetical protein